MATHYALTRPFIALSLETVLVIDLYPQANVLIALIEKENVDYLTSQRRAISFYLHCVSSSYDLSTVNLLALFLIQVNGFNKKIPPNVYLLCGDIHLETVARSLEQKRNANLADDSS